jgi:hypothetical protein
MVTRSGAGAINSPTGSGRVTSSADRRTNLPGGKSNKPTAKPTSARAITNGGSATMKQIRAKAVQARRQAEGKPVRGGTKGRALTTPNSAKAGKNLIREGANRVRNLADSGQVRAAAQRGQQAVEAAKRNRARLAAGVGKGAKEAAALKGAAGLAGKAALPVAIAAQAKDVVGGFQKLANHPFIKGRKAPAKPAPRPKKPASSKAETATKADFGKSFKAARAMGSKEFMFKGKRYNTKRKDGK